MLDAYIIERIRRERKDRESGRVPLRIEDVEPTRPPQSQQQQRKEDDERGIAIVDFTI